MALNYEQFREFLVNHLWKMGDTQVIAALDTLITMANYELNTMLDAIDNEVTISAPVVLEDMPLPADYNAFRDAYLKGTGELKYVTPAELFAQRDLTRSRAFLPIFSLGANSIYMAGPFEEATTPPTLYLTYQRKIPDFSVEGESWFAEQHLNAYIYAVLKHTGPFLREDERVALWTALFEDAMTKIRDMSEHKQTRGRAHQLALPYQASVISRRRR